jgi:hypothetical protein
MMVTGENYGIVVNGELPTKVHLQSLVLNELMGGALYIQGELAEVTAYSVTVQNTKLQEDLDQGKGMRLYDGTLEVDRSFIENNYFAGITCDAKIESTVFAKLDLKNSVIVDGKPCPSGSRNEGINGQGLMAWRCDTTINKVLIDNNSFYGIGMVNTSEIPAIMIATDILIRNTNPTPNLRVSDLFPWAENEAGFGMLLWGGEAYINRALLENNSTASIVVMESAYPCDPTTLESCDETFAVLENITSISAQMDTTGHFGNGAIIMDGAEALVSKASFDKSYNAGILVMDATRRNGSGDTIALFTDVQVSNVFAGDAADEASGTDSFGDGIVVASGALASFN